MQSCMKDIQGVYFDFGGVIGCPKTAKERKFAYLDWDGLGKILVDKKMSRCLLPGIGQQDLEAFFRDHVYDIFVQHEKTDLIDPRSDLLIREKLPLIVRCQIDQELIDRLLSYIDTMSNTEICNGARSTLVYLRKKNYRVSMISNLMLPGKLLRQKLLSSGILSYFDTITISSEVGFIKPHKNIFLLTAESDQLRAGQIVFVGDSYAQDIVGAKGVGMKTVWLNRSNDTVQYRGAAVVQLF